MMQRTRLLKDIMVICTMLFSVPGGFPQEKPVIGVAGISHESNSFSNHKTTLEDFEIHLGEGPDARAQRFFSLANAKTTNSGYIEGARRFGLELFPCLLANAQPKGLVTDHAFNTLMKEMLLQLKSGPRLDGILLNLPCFF